MTIGALARLGGALSVLLVACTADSPRAIETPISPTSSSPAVAFDIGPPPGNCPKGPKPRDLSPEFGPVVGREPVWTAGPGNDGLVLIDIDLPPTPHGQPVKFLWIAKPGSRGQIRLRGTENGSGEAVWFKIGQEDETREPVLDPEHPAIPLRENGPYPQFPSSLIFSRSGCYRLTAEWPGGSWTVDLTVGRQ